MSARAFEQLGALASRRGPIPLDQALAWLAVHEGATVQPELLLAEIDALASGVRVPPGATVVDAVARLNHRLFHEIGFRGDDEAYDDPANSRLDRVLGRRRGLPILLSALTMEVGRRAGIPIEGVGFPGHFLVAPADAEPRFFVDPFRAGHIWRREQLVGQLRRIVAGEITEAVIEAATRPVTPRQILVRVSRNLKGSWARRGDAAGALRAVERILQLVPDLAEERRDRGRLRVVVGDPEGAREDLQWYLEALPDAPDRARIEQELAGLE